MSKFDKLLESIRYNPQDVRFKDLCKVCEKFFGEPRQSKSSHIVYKTPWQGEPRINIQNKNGKAKPYQVREVIDAIDKLEKMKNENDPES